MYPSESKFIDIPNNNFLNNDIKTILNNSVGINVYSNWRVIGDIVNNKFQKMILSQMVKFLMEFIYFLVMVV